MVKYLPFALFLFFGNMLYSQQQETVIFEEQRIETQCGFNISKNDHLPSPPNAPMLPPPPTSDGFICAFGPFLEVMPLFAGGDTEGFSKAEKKNCSDQKMFEFIYNKLKWPPNFCGEGIVVIQFIIEVDGSTSGHKIVRDIGGGCGEEALRVVKLMPKWTPGKQRGREVDVIFNLPIRLRIE